MRLLLKVGLRFCNLFRLLADPDEPDVEGGMIAISGDCFSSSSGGFEEVRLRKDGSERKLSPGDVGSSMGGEVLGEMSASSGRVRETVLCMEDNDSRRRKVGDEAKAVGKDGGAPVCLGDVPSSGCPVEET